MSVGGLVTGLDTAALVQQLMAVERLPRQRIEQRRLGVEARLRALDDFAAKLAAVRTAARAFTAATGPIPGSVTSSAPSVVTASVTAGAKPAGLTFRVAGLAAAHQVSSAPLANAGALVGAGTVTAGSGVTGLGVTNVRAGATVAAGAHTLTVTQASAAATVTGAAVTGPVTIDATNDTLDVVVNGAARTVTIAAGTYATADALATAVATALGSDATARAAGGALTLGTVREGSTATFAVTGGSALAALGLAAATATGTGTGTDAVVTIGTTTATLTTVEAGTTATVAGFTLTLGAHLKAGSGGVVVARTTETSTVADLAAALGTGPVEAAVVDTGSDTRLVVSARSTGTANALTLDLDGPAGLQAGFTTLRSAADARLVVGEGAGALTVTRPSNTITDLLAGVTLNVAQAAPNTDVTVTVTRDVDGLVAQVKKLVDAVNTAVGTLKGYSTYDAKTGRTGPLSGNTAARDVLAGLFRDTSGLATLGVSAQRDGSLRLDEAALRAAVAADPDAVAAALSAGAPKSMDTRLGGALDAGGTVTAAKDGAQALARELQTRIDAWDPRLAKLEESYRRRFAALESAIGALRNQSSWLASQIAGLGR